ncbi:MAG: tetratricopeptide repeat protein [Pseudomonadota bacterium]
MKFRNLFFQPYSPIALLLLAVVALYAGSLSAPFVFDDFSFFSNADVLSGYGHGFSFGLRWLPYASLAWTADWLGFDRSWLRLGNVLLHAANSIALYFLLRRLFRITLAGGSFDRADGTTSHSTKPASGQVAGYQDRDAPGGLPSSLNGYALFGALLFALHPVAVYGVAYLIQRSTLMAALFMLLMLLAYLEGLQRENWRWMLVAALCYFAAVYSKEHSIAAPGVALAMTLLVRKPSAALFRQIAPYYAIATLIALSVVWITVSSKGVLGAAYEPNAGDMLKQGAKLQGLTDLPNLHLLSILTQCGLFFKYLWLWLVPNPAWMSVDMREPFAASLLGWHTLGLAGFLGYFCAAVWLLLKRGSRGLLGFALLFPWLLFLTEWSTVRIQEPFVLYRSYLWMPGLFAALPVVFGRLAPKKAYAVLGLASVLLVPLTLNRLDTFSSTLELWDDAEKLVRDKTNLPGVERIYINRGNKLFQLKRYDGAIDDFSKAISIYPGDELVYGSRAKAYYFRGEYQRALSDYELAIAMNPNSKRLYYDRALVYRALGDFAAAQEDLKRSCALGGICP